MNSLGWQAWKQRIHRTQDCSCCKEVGQWAPETQSSGGSEQLQKPEPGLAWDSHLTLAPTCSPGPHMPSLQDNFCLPWRCQVSDKDSGLFPLQLYICSGSSLEMLPFQAPRRVLGVETNLNTFAGMSAGGPERAVCTSVCVSIGPGASPIAQPRSDW